MGIGMAAVISHAVDARCPRAAGPDPDTAWFQPLGHPSGRPPGWADRFRASALSSDGSTVVGSVDFGDELFRWSADAGFEPIGFAPNVTEAYAADLSADGSVVVGRAQLWPGGNRPFRWNAAEGMTFLEPLPAGTTMGGADAVSADGSVVVGAVSGPQASAFKWSAATGYVILPPLEAGLNTAASAISADGSIVAGGSGSNPCRWGPDLAVQSLGLPFKENTSVYSISDDGSTITGFRIPGPTFDIFRWTSPDGAISLRHATSASLALWSYANADGSVIAGTELFGPFEAGPYTCTMWIAGQTRDLELLLRHRFGLNKALGAWDLESVRGISADGRTFAGVGKNPSGGEESWIAHIPHVPPPCAGDLNSSNTVDVSDLLMVIGSWGACGWPTLCVADIAPPDANGWPVGEGTVNVQDLLAVIVAWGACP